MNWRSFSRIGLGFSLLLFGGLGVASTAFARSLGDVDDDGIFTVMDLARQIAAANGRETLPEADRIYADVNADGVLNDQDSAEITKLILGTQTPAALAAASVRETSPAAGESGVALTREFVVRFTLPLALDAVVTTYNPNTQVSGHLSAEFGGRKLLTRAELSSDRLKATLFFLEPVPASARVRVTFDPTGLRDLLGRELDPAADGVAGGVATYDYDTLGITGLVGTGVTGTVYGVDVGASGGAATPRPLAGVTITVDGAEEKLRTTTDANGKFTLTPAPAGRFFVLIDGRTAGGSGGYFAFVGKAWEGVPGRLDTPATVATASTAAGDIYLPFIPDGTLRPVSATQDTAIGFAPSVLAANPGLASVEVKVPANSLFADNGARGGSVGIAPVLPERLPEPLPPGLNLPLVITIQTDGSTNFDRPVPVRFPNLADPVTGEKLPPGAKSALWSFDHDTGHWEIAGPMTVTADGEFVETDAGVGVRQPGWHGNTNSCEMRPPWIFDSVPDFGGSKKEKDCVVPVATALAEIGAESTACIGEFTGLKSLFDCVSTIVSLTGQAVTVASKAEKIIANPPPDMLEVLKETVEGLKTIRSDFEGMKNCIEAVEKQNPVSRALAVFNCLGNLINIGNSLCGLDEEDCFPSALNPPLESFCAITEVAAPFYDMAKDYVEIARSHQDAIVGNSLDLLLAKIDAIITLYEASQSSSRTGSRAFVQLVEEVPPQDVAKFAEAFRELSIAARNFRAEAAAVYEVSILAEEGVGYGLEIQSSAGDFVRAHLKKYVGRFYYLVKYGDTAVRGTCDPDMSPLFLRPNVIYSLSVLDAQSGSIGKVTGRTPSAGQSREFSSLGLKPPRFLPDGDLDGLSDEGEIIVGTDGAKVDTDGDGLSDGAEIKNGTNPLDGRPAAIGVIAAVDTPGNALDVAAANGLAAIADQQSGVTLFNVSNALNPVRIAQVDTPGDARAVAFGTSVLAVADGSAGLAIVDVSDPPAAAVLHQIQLSANVNAVATNATVAYVGLSDGSVVVVDMPSGTVMETRALGSGAIQDILIGREALYIYSADTLRTIDLREGALGPVKSLSVSGSVGAGGRRLRLSTDGDRLYATHTTGVNVFSLADPRNPVLSKENTTAQFGWKHLVPNGSGLAFAAVDPNSTNDGAHDVSLYTLGADGSLAFQTTFSTPGLASAVAIYNGLAYVADGQSGLQVVNYLAYDNIKQVPTISLSGTFPLGTNALYEEGKLARLSAAVFDDVQVRNVEFLIDGAVAATAGATPFDYRFTTPIITPERASFTVQARAYDTGGNRAETAVVTVQLVPDATPPRVVRITPADDSIVGFIDTLLVGFTEPMDSARFSSTTLVLRSAGSDGRFDTADDTASPYDALFWRAETNTLSINFQGKLPSGLYRLEVAAALTDLAGNRLAKAVTTTFTTLTFTDPDQDGVPDGWEITLGLDPAKADSNGNGISDGLEDFDGDGLGNSVEAKMGTRLNDADSDFDGLKDAAELQRGTNALIADTDADGWADGEEIADGTDPLSRESGLPGFALAGPALAVEIRDPSDVLSGGTVMAAPRVDAEIVCADETNFVASGTFVASPQISVEILDAASLGGFVPGTILAGPAVHLEIGDAQSETVGAVIARPPVDISRP